MKPIPFSLTLPQQRRSLLEEALAEAAFTRHTHIIRAPSGFEVVTYLRDEVHAAILTTPETKLVELRFATSDTTALAYCEALASLKKYLHQGDTPC